MTRSAALVAASGVSLPASFGCSPPCQGTPSAQLQFSFPRPSAWAVCLASISLPREGQTASSLKPFLLHGLSTAHTRRCSPFAAISMDSGSPLSSSRNSGNTNQMGDAVAPGVLQEPIQSPVLGHASTNPSRRASMPRQTMN